MDNDQDDFFKLNNKNIYLNSSYKTTLGENWIFNLQGALTHYNENILINDDQVQEQTVGSHLKTKLTRPFNKQFKLNMGAERLSTSFDQTFESNQTIINNGFNNDHLGSYMEADWYLSKKLVMRL